MTDLGQFFIGGRFDVGRFPWNDTDRSVWYALFLARGETKGSVPPAKAAIGGYGFASSLQDKAKLITALEGLAPDDPATLIGVWTGQYCTSLFPLDRAKALAAIKKSLADHAAGKTREEEESMTIHDIMNGIVLAAGTSIAMLGQVDAAGITPSLLQLGAIGIILAWITMVDIPQRNKAAEKREEAAEKSALAREQAWREIFRQEQTSCEARMNHLSASYEAALKRLGDLCDKQAEATEHLAISVADLTELVRDERAAAKAEHIQSKRTS